MHREAGSCIAGLHVAQFLLVNGLSVKCMQSVNESHLYCDLGLMVILGQLM